MNRFVLIGLLGIAMQLVVCQTANAQTFSVENSSFDVAGGIPSGDDILSPGFVAGAIPGLALPGFGQIEVDGFTYGRQFHFEQELGTFEFSVDAFATGVPGSGVFIESAVGSGEQNYDVYRTDLATAGGFNVQIHDGDGFGPGGTVSPLGMFEPQSVLPNPVHPGVDGYDSRITPGQDIYWTWENRFNPPPPAGGSVSGADVMFSNAVPGYDGVGTVFASSLLLGLDGLGFGTDNIDALEVFDYGNIGFFDQGLDIILFSLDPSSLSLGGGFTAGDILFSSGGGAFGLALPHIALGLTPNDNLTALSVIPEPSSALICLLALGLAASKRRRRI